ncbi:MAG: hypothetical protein DRP96_10865 [Candidatus Neomarinimicrobiota bacterium]|nr:MAG: hypothetical protein DRP96_10865 [Candidatus Neomarinimicrobiota bacterium]HDL02642.1 hypothetical protein [candidate division Zixibacteria bacterium]
MIRDDRIDMTQKQQQYFKDFRGSRIFFSYHPPDKNRESGRGILICDAILEEKQDSRRAMVNFANLAAENGFGVLRFDYRGQGESEGEFSDFGPADIIEDIRFAYRELEEKSGTSKIGILSLRFGCNLAVAAAKELRPEFMVFWAPEVSSKNYAEFILRSNLTNQLIVYKKVIEDRKALIRRMKAGEIVNVDGYGLTLEWYEYISGDDFARHLSNQDNKILIMDIDPHPERNSRRWDSFRESLEEIENGWEITRVKGDIFWKLTPIYAERPKEPFERTIEFLEKNV